MGQGILVYMENSGLLEGSLAVQRSQIQQG